MMPTMVRSVSTWVSPTAYRAAEPLTVKTHLPGGTPTGSQATLSAPRASVSTRRDRFFSPGERREVRDLEIEFQRSDTGGRIIAAAACLPFLVALGVFQVIQVVIRRIKPRQISRELHVAAADRRADGSHQLRCSNQELFVLAGQFLELIDQSFIGTRRQCARCKVVAAGFGNQAAGQRLRRNFLPTAVFQIKLAQLVEADRRYRMDGLTDQLRHQLVL